MLVGQVRMDRERVQLLDERASLRVGHSDDVLGVIAKVEALAAGFRMRPDDRVIHRRLG